MAVRPHIRSVEKYMNMKRALQDLEERTLNIFPCELAKLIYLASTRDYTTGQYFHNGLAAIFTYAIAEQALRTAHCQKFEILVFEPLEALVSQVDQFVIATSADRITVLATWRNLEPYRIAIPSNADPIRKALFISNVRLAVEVLSDRHAMLQNPQSSWQQP
jgi:hypothetical protein